MVNQEDELLTEVENEYKNVELVRNPFIAYYLLQKQHGDEKNLGDFQFDVNEEDLIPINQDILYNDKVSVANTTYKYTDKVRETTNIRYVKSTSDAVPSYYRDNLIEFGADTKEEFLIPFDYILVTRDNGSQFMIAEDFSNPDTPLELHKYSIIRYSGKNNPFKTDSIYSNGIDLARILSNDKEYINVFANNFLSEHRLNESLLSAFSVMDKTKSDDTDHGAGYVGFIDSNSLNIDSTLGKNELLLLERVNDGRGVSV